MACVRTEEVRADTGLRRTVRTHHDEVGLDRLRLIEDFLVDAALASLPPERVRPSKEVLDEVMEELR
jgi:hypothetical protein